MKEKEYDDEVGAIVLLRLKNGVSISDLITKNQIDPDKFESDPEYIARVKKFFEGEGIEISAVGRLSLTIETSRDRFEKLFNVELQQEEIEMFIGDKHPDAEKFTYFTSVEPIGIPKNLKEMVESIVLELPFHFLESPTPPIHGSKQIDVPDRLAQLIGADQAHQRGIDGSGVKAVLIDSGVYNHAYFQNKGYNIHILRVRNSPLIDRDPIGHGTSVASCLLAIAPRVELSVISSIRYINGRWYPRFYSAYLRATQLGPDYKIIVGGWGIDERMLAAPGFHSFFMAWDAAVRSAATPSHTQIFPCGNDGVLCFPATHQLVIAAGGATPVGDTSIDWYVSNISSSGKSTLINNRYVPDVCGVMGDESHNVILVTPTSPGSYLDQISDKTGPSDGWVAKTGTSHAAAVVAGVAALRCQFNVSDCSSYMILKNRLINNAIDVQKGKSANGDSAVIGDDLATGKGVVDADAVTQ